MVASPSYMSSFLRNRATLFPIRCFGRKLILSNIFMPKLGVLCTLATRAMRVSDVDHFSKEKSHLLKVFVNNGYSKKQGLKSFFKASKSHKVKKDPNDHSYGFRLPFIQGTTDRIVRILRKHNVPSTFRPLNTIRSSLKSAKDPVDPKDMKGVYVIP